MDEKSNSNFSKLITELPNEIQNNEILHISQIKPLTPTNIQNCGTFFSKYKNEELNSFKDDILYFFKERENFLLSKINLYQSHIVSTSKKYEHLTKIMKSNYQEIITSQANLNGGQSAENNKIVLVGGNQMITLISVKLKMIISKLMIPEANAIRIIINSGYNFNTNNIICSGLFRQYSFDLVNYSIIKNSNNQFQLMETCRYAEVDKNLINSILILKKSNAKSASDVEMFTGGNDKIIKIYS